jgi:drug/metabolite transporter (DMT)-like permease
MLLTLAALWGASYLFIKIGLEGLSPAMVVFVRTALGALVLMPLAARRGALARLRGLVLPVTALAAIQVAGPFVLISEGERWIDSSLAGILVASAPIFTALIALGLTGEERANVWSVGGLAIGIAGVALLLGVDAGGSHLALLGAFFVLMAGLGYAIGAFIVKRGFRGVDPVCLVAATMAASALLVLPAAVATFPQHVPRAGVWAAMGALGAGGTGLAFVLFYTLIQREGPSRAAIVAYIAPAFAVVYGVTLRGESFGASTAGGLVLILAGSWLAAEARAPWRPRTSLRVVEPKTSENAPFSAPRRMFDSPPSGVARTGERHR